MHAKVILFWKAVEQNVCLSAGAKGALLAQKDGMTPRCIYMLMALVASTAAIPSTLLRDSKHAHTVGKMMSQSEPCTSSYKEDTSSKECDWGGYWCGRRVNGYTGCDRCSCQGCDPKICPPGEDPGVPYDGGIGGGRDLCATDHTQC
jgi:hypothetical protein